MQKEKNVNVNTPYDDVFRTLLNDCSKLIIPVVNEVFHTEYQIDENIRLFNNELFINLQDGKQLSRVTDSNFIIGHTRYHIECQSSEDGTMMIRVFEYDSQIALQNYVLEANKLIVNFPNTALLYLRHTEKTKDYMKIQINVRGDSCSYDVPIIKIQNYTIDEIFKKNLLFLIPFYIFMYEKEFEVYDSNEEKLEQLKTVYKKIIDKLDVYSKRGLITEYTKHTIIVMSKKVLEQLAKKYSNVEKEIGDIMGGKILDYEAKDILNEGRAQGLVQGVKDGENKLSRLISLLVDEELVEIVKLVTSDEEAREQYYTRYGIK